MATRNTEQTDELDLDTACGEISPLLTGVKSRCPCCGKGALFKGLLTVRDRCDYCGLDLSAADPGDGPAVFVILVLGFLAAGAAVILELNSHPPLWFHVVLWVPLVLGGSIGLLRPFKATLIALQFRHNAAEARLEEPDLPQ